MSYAPYPAYKDGGVPWLGQIPEEWDVKALRYIGQPIIGLTYSPNDVVGENEGTLVLRANNIQDGKISLGDNVFVAGNIPEKLFIKAGDILVCSRNGSRHLIGKNALIAEDHDEWSFGAFTTVIRSKYGPFLYWVMNSKMFEYQSGRFLTTTINQLTSGVLNSFEIPFPSIEEQNSITLFLNQKTAEIDDLIAKKEEILQLLSEQRISLITHAVTKGLDPSAPMKSTGVAWLDQIPEGWDVMPLKFVSTCNDEALPESTDPELVLNYVDISSVSLVGGIQKIEQIEFEKAPSRARRVVRDGDTIVSTVRTYLKAIAAIREPVENMIVSTGFAVIRPNKSMNPDFLGYFIQSEGFVGEVVSRSTGVSYPAINPGDLVGIVSLRPPLEEQAAISFFLDQKTGQIDAAKEKIETAINKLKEYRTALITDAVTGKIKVA